MLTPKSSRVEFRYSSFFQIILVVTQLLLVLVIFYCLVSFVSLVVSGFFMVCLLGLCIYQYTLLRSVVESTYSDIDNSHSIANQLESTQLSEKLMFSAIAEPVIGVDKNLQIILVNEAAEKLTGWNAQSALGIHINTVLKLKNKQDKDIKLFDNPFLKVFEKNTNIITSEFHIVQNEGKKRLLSIAITPSFDQNNSIVSATAIMHDISEQDLQSREKNEFISTASHEMRTPIAQLEGYLSMATNPKLATIDSRASLYLQKAHEASVHLGKLFEDLLNITNYEDQQFTDKPEQINVTPILQAAVAALQPKAAQKGLKLELQLGQQTSRNEVVIVPSYFVYGDGSKLHNIFTKIIENGISYTEQGNVAVVVSTVDNQLKIEVVDTGVGISPSDQKHLFEKFYRVDNSKIRNTGGTGLGLYIVRNLIELYGGKIEVSSTLAKGSTFTIYLPLLKI